MRNRESRKNELIERVNRELQRGESLLYCQQQPAGNPIAGIVLMIIGSLWIILFLIAAIALYMDNQTSMSETLIAGGIFSLIGAVLIFGGYRQAFIINDNYYFVTNERLCLRGKDVPKKRIDRDFLLSTIENVYIKEERVGKTCRYNIAVKIENNNYPFTFLPFNRKLMMSTLETAIKQNKK